MYWWLAKERLSIMEFKRTVPFCSIVMYLMISAVYAQSDESCVLEGRQGICIPIRSCAPLLQQLVSAPRPIPADLREQLRKAGCGFEGNSPKVCCTSSVTNTETSDGPETPDAEQNMFDLYPPPDVSRHRNLGLLPTYCGPLEDDRIVGGNKTGIMEFPWMALIAYNIKSGSRSSIGFRCGGTLISARYVLTAAHCVSHLSARLSLAGVRLGEHNTRTDPDCQRLSADDLVCAPPVQDFTIEEAIPHSAYTPQRLQDDIGLIRLSAPADLTKGNVIPICLPVSREVQRGTLPNLVTVAGWGATEQGPQSAELLRVDLPLVSNSACSKIHNKSVVAGIWYKQICAGGVDGADSCGGDSGGPLKVSCLVGLTTRYVQHGIVSFGPKRCGTGGFPGVYTRVAYYVDWILDQMKP